MLKSKLDTYVNKYVRVTLIKELGNEVHEGVLINNESSREQGYTSFSNPHRGWYHMQGKYFSFRSSHVKSCVEIN